MRLGKKPDPKKLPDRIVPRQQTAPDEANGRLEEHEPGQAGQARRRPASGTAQAGHAHAPRRQAQAFAEIQEEKEREGDPNGIADGTETEAQVGDIYLGKIAALFKRGWTIPSTLGDTSRLEGRHHVRDHLRPAHRPLRDRAVERRAAVRSIGRGSLSADARREHASAEPPPEVADQFLGQTLGVRFKGKAVISLQLRVAACRGLRSRIGSPNRPLVVAVRGL